MRDSSQSCTIRKQCRQVVIKASDHLVRRQTRTTRRTPDTMDVLEMVYRRRCYAVPPKRHYTDIRKPFKIVSGDPSDMPVFRSGLEMCSERFYPRLFCSKCRPHRAKQQIAQRRSVHFVLGGLRSRLLSPSSATLEYLLLEVDDDCFHQDS